MRITKIKVNKIEKISEKKYIFYDVKKDGNKDRKDNFQEILHEKIKKLNIK